jgi:hypothetical protein
MKHERDYKLQDSFHKCKVSLVYEFCKINSINTQIYEDETGIRFFIHYSDIYEGCDRIYCSPDNGFTYYITYAMFRDKLINDFTRFKRLKAFL